MFLALRLGKEISSFTPQDLTSYCAELSGTHIPTDICYGTHLSYDISQVTVIKSRPDANNPCDETLHNEDHEIIHTVLNHK